MHFFYDFYFFRSHSWISVNLRLEKIYFYTFLDLLIFQIIYNWICMFISLNIN